MFGGEDEMEMIIAVCVVFWAVALVHLCTRRDIEIHRKLSWVVTILVLNALGALLYLFFGPKRSSIRERGPDVPPFQPEGRSWNPIIGENRFAEGEGLNPKEDTSPNQPPEATR
jgi:hypothetical protein